MGPSMTLSTDSAKLAIGLRGSGIFWLFFHLEYAEGYKFANLIDSFYFGRKWFKNLNYLKNLVLKFVVGPQAG